MMRPPLLRILSCALLQLVIVTCQGQSTTILTPRELLATAQAAGAGQVIRISAGQAIALRDATSSARAPVPSLADGLVLQGAGVLRSILDLRRLSATSSLELQAGERRTRRCRFQSGDSLSQSLSMVMVASLRRISQPWHAYHVNQLLFS